VSPCSSVLSERSGSAFQFICVVLSAACVSDRLLQRHRSVRHSTVPSSSTFSCPVPGCDYAARTQSLLLRHRARHRVVVGQSSVVVDGGLVGRYRCGRCSYETAQREHFRRHVESVHDNVRPWLCHVCGRTFNRRDALLHHSNVHDNSAKAQRSHTHTCTICHRSFRSKVGLLLSGIVG